MFLLRIINVCLFISAVRGENDSKRLLLNDPSVTIDRLNRLESMILAMNNTQQQLKSKNEEQEKEIQTLKVTNEQQSGLVSSLQQQLQATQKGLNETGSTYIRWGHTKCQSNGTKQIYSGFAGGGKYTETGSAAEYVCLPPDPDFIKTHGSNYAHMYGAEYDSSFFKADANGEDIPCAVCRSKHATSIMIPGKSKCYHGWNREYYGYLASGDHVNNVATSYICVDINPEYVMGGIENKNEKVAGEVLAQCGTLKCPPYFHNYPLTCVVCSK